MLPLYLSEIIRLTRSPSRPRPRPRRVHERERGARRKRIQVATRTSVPMTRFIWAGRAGGMAAM